VPYQSPNLLFLKVHNFIKVQLLHKGIGIFIGVSQASSACCSQLDSQGFILFSSKQSNMAKIVVDSLTIYLKFVGRGDEDVGKHWYLCEVVWRACQTPDATKIIEFQTMLWDRALRWFIKWINANPNASINLVKKEYIQEFKLCRQINKDWRNY